MNCNSNIVKIVACCVYIFVPYIFGDSPYQGVNGFRHNHDAPAHQPLAHLESQSNLKDLDCSSQLNGNKKSQHSQHPKERDPNSNSTFTKSIFPWMKESTRQICKKNNRDKPVKVYGVYSNAGTQAEVFHLNRFLCHLRRVEMPNQLNLTERSTRKYKKDENLGYINAMGDDDDDDDDYDAVSPPSLKLQYVTFWVTDQIHIEMGVIEYASNPYIVMQKKRYFIHNAQDEIIKHALKLTH
uniref:Secreted protein n=1 Tax=Oncorhynchus tshawytscha TaxID=74940 RepID=A0A8C8K1X5_ONCTS